jgi:rhodanese-related sulfurtransferase
MPSPTSISIQKLARLVGTARGPAIIDVRTDDDYAADPRLIPGSRHRSFADAPDWSAEFAGRSAVVICQKGLKLSEGAAAWLRHNGVPADVLDGGFEAWRDGGLPLLATAKVPAPDRLGRTVWVTRARPKIDRIACPWLIRRFVDPSAVFLFVAPAEVAAVADRFGATPFDIEDVFWSHRGDQCTFDTMIAEFGLASEPLLRLASIVRGADTGRFDLAPQAAGLLAVSLGLSRLHADDLKQLEAGLTIYDALYLWCRDAVDEGHGWPAAKSAAKPR